MNNSSLPSASQAIAILQTIQKFTAIENLAFWVAPNSILTLAGGRTYCDGVFYNDNLSIISSWQKEIESGARIIADNFDVLSYEVKHERTGRDESYVSYDVFFKKNLASSIKSSRLINDTVIENLTIDKMGKEIIELLRTNVDETIAEESIRTHVVLGVLLGYPDVAILDYLLDDEQRDPFSAPYIDADIRGAKYYDCPQPIYQYRRTLITNPEIIAHETLWSNILKEYYTSDFHKSLEADPQFQAKLKEIGSLN